MYRRKHWSDLSIPSPTGESTPLEHKSDRHLIRLTNEGDADAAFYLATRYLFGSIEGIQVDVSRAVSLFAESAKLGNALAYHNLGIYMENGFSEFEIYQDDFAPDYQSAFSMFLEAANRNSPMSAGKVGEYYLKGLGAVQSYRLATQWLAMGSEYGDKLSLYLLGVINEEGIGIAANKVDALMYFNLAATYGFDGLLYESKGLTELCISCRDRLNNLLSLEQITDAQNKAVSFKPRQYPKLLLD